MSETIDGVRLDDALVERVGRAAIREMLGQYTDPGLARRRKLEQATQVIAHAVGNAQERRGRSARQIADRVVAKLDEYHLL